MVMRKSESIIISYNEDGYKDNKTALDEARKIVKDIVPTSSNGNALFLIFICIGALQFKVSIKEL